MAFFVVQRDADSALSIPLPDAYPTRDAAIAALSAATASGSLVLRGEVFIADLSTAVPVLVMQAAPVVAVPEAPVLAEAEPGLLDDAAADALYAPPLLGDEQSLAAALKRAATSLEEEGIIAPASVESEPSDAAEPATDTDDESDAAGERPWEWANVEAYDAPADQADEVESAEVESAVEDEVPAEAEPAVEADEAEAEADEPAEAAEPEDEATEGSLAPEDSSPLAAEPGEAALDEALAQLEAPADEDGDSPYVEAPVEEIPEALVAEPRDESAAAEDDVLVAALDGELYELPATAFGEPAGDDSPIITSAPADGEDAYVPRPVILGDYADVVVPGGLEIEEPGDEVAEPTPVEPALLEPALVEPLIEPVLAESLMADPVEAPVTLMAADLVETGYEATGELDLGGYTCQDCVYSNTCPKVGQASPSDCGSFQWRSE